MPRYYVGRDRGVHTQPNGSGVYCWADNEKQARVGMTGWLSLMDYDWAPGNIFYSIHQHHTMAKRDDEPDFRVTRDD